MVLSKTTGIENEATARLIAAAPDMLAVLKRLVDDPVVRVDAEDEERFAAILDSAHAAIAKAEGKS